MSEFILRAEGVTKDYVATRGLLGQPTRLVHAVRGVSLAVAPGTTLALVGESGSGKSTLGRCIAGLLRPTSGHIELAGHDVRHLAGSRLMAFRRQVQTIFQDPYSSLNPRRRVGDAIMDGMVIHKLYSPDERRDRMQALLARVGLRPEHAQRFPHQFSGGQRQRIAIARALALEPRFIIADEAVSALDVSVKAQVLDLLADIQREIGMAVLLITHDLAVVRNVAHHVALMRRGEIVESASAEEFFRAPKHPYARQLFDAIPTFEKRGAPLSEAGRAAQGAEGARRGPREPGVVLDVQDLKVHYPVRKGPLRRVAAWVKAVDGVTFSLRAGETLALLGESGCGKTTTGKALLRLIDGARISGRAMLQGQDLLTADRARLQRLRQDIQIVFQDPYASLDPRMRVGDILDEGLESLRRGMGAQERRDRAVRLVERVGLPANTLARYPHEFSGGQRQRIAIARALAVEPKVLICDEPTSALDVSVQAQILDLLRELQDELGIAYLFITHNFGVVEYLADRIAVMDGGRIVELGEADAVLHAPRQDMTRRLLDAVPRLQFGAPQ